MELPLIRNGVTTNHRITITIRNIITRSLMNPMNSRRVELPSDNSSVWNVSLCACMKGGLYIKMRNFGISIFHDIAYISFHFHMDRGRCVILIYMESLSVTLLISLVRLLSISQALYTLYVTCVWLRQLQSYRIRLLHSQHILRGVSLRA